MNRKTLFLITASYPYGSYETFLESEIPILSKKFNKIFIITNSKPSKIIRDIPDNLQIYYFSYLPTLSEKIASLKYLFNRMFWKEFHIIIFRYKIFPTYQILSTILTSLRKGQNLCNFIIGITKKEKLILQDTLGYSYWCNNMAIGLALLKRKNPGIRVITRGHGWDVYFFRNKINYLPHRFLIFQNLDSIHFISDHGYQYCSRLLRENFQEKFFVSRLGSKDLQGNIKKSSLDSFKFISCSSLIPLKRVDLIVKLLYSLGSTGININWTHIGSGPLYQDIKKESDEITIKYQNIKITFLGQLSNEEVLNLYRNEYFDLFISLSEYEGIPVSIMEAISAGTPVLATNVGGNSEIVGNKSGYLVSANPTIEELAEKVLNFINLSPQEMEDKRVYARKVWNKLYNAELNYKDFVDDIVNLLG
ncbi:MAG: glycosyltransferase [Cytophagales bacterium]|nr:glycosyltransferase [Cytophagales bacterium]